MIATKATEGPTFFSSTLYNKLKGISNPTFKLRTECPVIMPTACKIFGCYRAEVGVREISIIQLKLNSYFKLAHTWQVTAERRKN